MEIRPERFVFFTLKAHLNETYISISVFFQPFAECKSYVHNVHPPALSGGRRQRQVSCHVE